MRAAAALVGVAVLAVAGCSTSAQARTLRLAFRAGEQYGYSVTSASTYTGSPQANVHMAAREMASVMAVAPSGETDIVLSLQNVTFDGRPDEHQTMPVQIRLSPDGHVTLIGGVPAGETIGYVALGYGGKALITVVLPDRPVKPGDTWTKSFDTPLAGGNATGGEHVTSTATYLRDERFKGVNAVVVETRTVSTGGGSFDTATGHTAIADTQTIVVTSWLDPSTSRILRSVTTRNGSVVQTTSSPTGAGSVSYVFSGTDELLAT